MSKAWSEAQFKKAVEIGAPKDGPLKPSQDQQLMFYKYYKQATVGDVNTARPGMLDFVGKAKWDAWKSVEGTTPEAARNEYVALLLEILGSAEDEDLKKWKAEIESA